MKHRWVGNHPVSLQTTGGSAEQVPRGGFVDIDMDDPHVKEYLSQGLLLAVAPSSTKAPISQKGGE